MAIDWGPFVLRRGVKCAARFPRAVSEGGIFCSMGGTFGWGYPTSRGPHPECFPSSYEPQLLELQHGRINQYADHMCLPLRRNMKLYPSYGEHRAQRDQASVRYFQHILRSRWSGQTDGRWKCAGKFRSDLYWELWIGTTGQIGQSNQLRNFRGWFNY